MSHFFRNDSVSTEFYTLSLHDALPICSRNGSPAPLRGNDARAGLGQAEVGHPRSARPGGRTGAAGTRLLRSTKRPRGAADRDRKSTRLNSSHLGISYADFCLKKKKDTPRAAEGPGASDPGRHAEPPRRPDARARAELGAAVSELGSEDAPQRHGASALGRARH